MVTLKIFQCHLGLKKPTFLISDSGAAGCTESSQKLAKGKAGAVQKDTSLVDLKTGQPSLTPFSDAAHPIAVCI